MTGLREAKDSNHTIGNKAIRYNGFLRVNTVVQEDEVNNAVKLNKRKETHGLFNLNEPHMNEIGNRCEDMMNDAFRSCV